MERLALNPFLKELENLCISIILPTHRVAPGRRGDEHDLKRLVSATKSTLVTNHAPDQTEKLLQLLDKTIDKIDFLHNSDGLGIYVSANFQQLVRFNFPVKEKIVVRKGFELKELLYLNSLDRKYLILEVNEKSTRLFEGVLEHIKEIRDERFPQTYEEEYEYAKPARGTSYGGHANLKDVEKDKSVLEAIRLKDFFRTSDHRLQNYLADGVPLIVVGPEKDITSFKEVSRHVKNIVDILPGNYAYFSSSDLAERVWPKMRAFFYQEKLDLIKEYRDKVGKGLGEGGIVNVWEAARQGRGLILLVDKEYSQKGFVGLNDGTLYLAQPLASHRTVEDAVEDCIQVVIEKGGDVVVTDPDTLKNEGGIALITRY